ncbi:MAG: DNA polymerase/3'-5' exonuclease PolX [Deltaproteobacteria bacterium]|nr:DNA polymerase/3'-5' exonuclease PolX [Deltaproteobacteria bacterium]
MDKAEVIEILSQIGTLLELIGENPFKVRAYYNAARTLEGRSESMEELVGAYGHTPLLQDLPGFGEALTEKITILVTTGKLKYFEELKKKVPAGLLEMIRIPGLGPKKVKALYDQLKIDTIAKLKEGCEKGKIRSLEGFGEKTEKKILDGIQHLKVYAERRRYDEALVAALPMLERLKKDPKVIRAEVCGSMRRHRETIGDIDILASSKDPASVMERFVTLPEVESVVAHGGTKSAITLKKNGVQVDLRVVSDVEFPFALHYFTGSAEHNTQLRTLAKEFDLKLNEYGLFKGTKRISCKDESEIFKKLKLSYIPPELREGMGEIEAAKEGKIPDLLESKDIRGVFHIHSTWSDGTAPLEEMVAEAERLGLEYIGLSDHSQSAYYAGGLKPDRLKEQEKEIERLRKKFKIRIFWGTESDILPDGSLDYPEKILERFDFVIGSVHSSFTMPESEMTMRIIRAFKNKYFTMLGHATGRLILQREGYAVDMKQVIQAAADYRKVIELNANPHRFDLDWRLGPFAKEKKVRVCINPDAHSVEGIAAYLYGIGIARKGWFTKKDVLNSLSAQEMERYLRTKAA